jgi:Protein of unknown function (DUF1588)/Protein of unknown function (DUF1592)/Protein of unknown function (DUF1595)/Protein of unknown function (DUF1587)/Protein of unknown function (DUF1585)
MTVFRPASLIFVVTVLVGTNTGACTGQIEPVDSDDPARDVPDPGRTGGSRNTGTITPKEDECAPTLIPPAGLRRLTRRQYEQTVDDLLGGGAEISKGFAPEGGSTGFDSASDGVLLNDAVIEQYVRAARTLSGDAVKKLAGVVPCDPVAKGESGCARAIVEEFGRRAFRRSLTNEEVNRYTGFFAQTRMNASYVRSLELVLQAFLISPQFLYQIQGLDQTVSRDGWVALTPNELATRLSYFLWDTTPSDALLELAATGGLDTAEQVKGQAIAMLKAENGNRLIRHFFSEWLDLDRLPGLVRGTQFTASTGNTMRTEAETYFDTLIRGRNASWQELLTSQTGFANAERDPAHHLGFLTLPGILSLHAFPNDASPIHRGVFIREQLLCEPHIPPPANIDVMVPPPDSTTTARQQLETKTQEVSPCRSCHERINPPGFAFDGFDQLGKWRDTDRQGRPFDTSGMLIGTDKDGPFNNHRDLIERLSTSATASDCFVTQWFRYGMARLEEADECGLRALQNVFRESGGDVGALVLAIVTDVEFLNKRVEVSP